MSYSDEQKVGMTNRMPGPTTLRADQLSRLPGVAEEDDGSIQGLVWLMMPVND